MTNIQLSKKGKAFLKRGQVALQVALAIAERKDDLETDEGLVVHLENNAKVRLKSAAAFSLAGANDKV